MRRAGRPSIVGECGEMIGAGRVDARRQMRKFLKQVGQVCVENEIGKQDAPPRGNRKV